MSDSPRTAIPVTDTDLRGFAIGLVRAQAQLLEEAEQHRERVLAEQHATMPGHALPMSCEDARSLRGRVLHLRNVEVRTLVTFVASQATLGHVVECVRALEADGIPVCVRWHRDSAGLICGVEIAEALGGAA